ncbi:NADPH:quinone reductase [Actinomortierella ambigua]|nr:NADPH:quinone reductase [Actinomortierella ambigua]
MRAIQITAPGDTSILKVSTIPKPVPKPNEVLVKICFSGVTFRDSLCRSGKFPFSLPGVLGSEASGEIVKLGSQVTGHSVGDRVAILDADTYAEYAAVREDRAAKIPDGVSYEQAAGALSNGMTSLGLVLLAYKVQRDDWVLIHAAGGGLGLVLCQLCKQAGARVIGLTSSDAKAELAMRAGADHVLNTTMHSHDEIFAEIGKLTNGQLVDVVYDSVGADTFELSLRSTRRFGTVIVYGLASGPVPPFDLMSMMYKSVKVTFFGLYAAMTTRGEFNSLANATLKLVADGKLDLNISKIYPLEQAKDAHDALESRRSTGKLLLRI